MAEFLTTLGTSSKIEEIMYNAKKEIYLVSPFLQISNTFLERLKEASDNGVVVKIIYGKDELKPNERNSLADIPKLELFFFKNLHAKCYLNESKMVITSMNMYEFSERNNREMGVWIDAKNDSELYENAKRETLSILKLSEKVNLKPNGSTFPPKEFTVQNLSEPKQEKKSFAKFSLNVLDKFLSDEFKDSRINAAKDYLFSENLIPVFHVFITSTNIKLKLPVHNPSPYKMRMYGYKLKYLAKSYDITFNEPSGGYSYYTWEIDKFQSLKDYSYVISELQKIKF